MLKYLSSSFILSASFSLPLPTNEDKSDYSFSLPLPNDKALDCAVRQAAYTYAIEIQSQAQPAFFDALALNEYCNVSIEKREWKNNTSYLDYEYKLTIIPTFYADAKIGDDTNPGTLAQPFRSLFRGVSACRGKGGCNLLLSDSAPFVLNTTLILGELDSGLTIGAIQGQSPILTSGISINNWSPLKIDSENNIWRANLPPNIPLPRALLVGGRRYPRARWPNSLNWETDRVPVGYTNATSWNPPHTFPSATPLNVADAARPFDFFFPNWTWATGGVADEFFDPPEGYWISPKPAGGDTFAVPSGFKYSPLDWSPRAQLWNITAGGGAVVKVFHGQYWGSWAFELSSLDASNGFVVFGKGGWQEARGSQTGGALYIENIREELDSPNEWFADLDSNTLDLFWNETIGTPPSPGIVSIATLENLILIEGSLPNSPPVQNISIVGLTITGTQPTFLSQKFVAPSGGDWSFAENAAIILRGAESVRLISCSFSGLGGNAILIRGRNRDLLISNSTFDRCGDSAIVSAGRSTLANLSSLDVPVNTVISGCRFSNLGVDVKQSGGIYSALSANMTIERNIFFSLPRAAININDGAHGGHVIRRNIFAQTVLDTADHGSLNTWDREPYIQTYNTSERIPLTSTISFNFFINSGYGIHSLDHDDGSNSFLDENNVLCFSGFKNYLGFSRLWTRNLIIRPDYLSEPPSIPNKTPSGIPLPQFYYFPACVRSVGQYTWETLADSYTYNTCIQNSSSVYIFGRCNPSSPSSAGDVPRASNNTYFVQDGSIMIECGGKTLSLSEAQAVGYEINSTEFNTTNLSIDDIVRMIENLLSSSSSTSSDGGSGDL
jgi:hypothetical protein